MGWWKEFRQKSCVGKQRFATAVAAKRAMAALERAKGKVGFMKPYRCGFCRQFHYGHPRRPYPVSSEVQELFEGAEAA